MAAAPAADDDPWADAARERRAVAVRSGRRWGRDYVWLGRGVSERMSVPSFSADATGDELGGSVQLLATDRSLYQGYEDTQGTASFAPVPALVGKSMDRGGGARRH